MDYKTRAFFTLQAVLNNNFARACFIIKSLWYPKPTSIMWVLTGINYHNYTSSLKKGTYV